MKFVDFEQKIHARLRAQNDPQPNLLTLRTLDLAETTLHEVAVSSSLRFIRHNKCMPACLLSAILPDPASRTPSPHSQSSRGIDHLPCASLGSAAPRDHCHSPTVEDQNSEALSRTLITAKSLLLRDYTNKNLWQWRCLPGT
ncbi:hypothetical protein L798_13429 [Zootermopsis nevadensis]|uniref:Uncharacterized protein n=1 Tax=Zootermopsis nevadensis TaxID=136037 RepID=A0A067QYQ7_ZOONE|nr:hypothetical protein L798_13429 [Zootermopsis nevadensis]